VSDGEVATMRAAVFQGVGQPLAIRTVPDPEPGAAELVLGVRASGICGSDLHLTEVADTSGGLAPLPMGAILGHEFSGEVVAVGRDVAGRFRVGDRVTSLPYIACGSCAACLTGQGHRCPASVAAGLGALPGAYAEYVRVGVHETLPLPDEVDDRAGAMVEPLSVGLHAVEAARLRAGEAALVIGAGPIGLAVSLWCRFFGAAHVVVSDLSPARADRAASMGATAVVHAGQEDVVAAVKRQCGRRAEVVFDCVGVPGSQQLAMDYAPAGGRIVVAGVCMRPDRVLPVKAITKELEVRYVFGYGKRDFAFAIDMLARGRVDAAPMLSETVGWDAFPAAFESLRADKRRAKVMLEPRR
jgi:(R,R)-butanediol dehydrogenase/meso-butanediol dehydrogenase/diacetyl reductase